MSEKLVYEGDIAEQLGLSRKDVARLRKELDLIEEVDWCNGPHRRLMLTESGFKKIIAATEQGGGESARSEGGAVDEPGAVDGSAERSYDAPMPVLPELRVPKKLEARVRRVPKFRKLMECTLETDEKPVVQVRVQNNENFTAGMVVQIREAVGQGAGVYYYDGTLPRRKGILPKR